MYIFQRRVERMQKDDLISRIPGTRVTPSQFRSKMGDMLARVQYGGETVVIATRGKRVAILCPPENWRERKGG
jgi:prevent-host-death family protein